MDVLYAHCAGLDIHKDTVVARSRRVTAGKVMREVRTFKTTTGELLALSEWLGSLGADRCIASPCSVPAASLPVMLLLYCFQNDPRRSSVCCLK